MRKMFLLALLVLSIRIQCISQNITLAFKIDDLHLVSVLHDSKGFLYAFGYKSLYHEYMPYHGYETPTYFKIRKYDPVNGAMIWERYLYSSKVLTMAPPRIVDDMVHLAGYFSDTLTGDFGIEGSGGGFDYLFAQVDENGFTNIVTGGGEGDQMIESFLPGDNGLFYVAGRANGKTIFGANNYTFTEQHSFLSLSNSDLSAVNWIRLAKAIPEKGVASFQYLKRYKDFLYSRSHGESLMLGTSCTFGGGDYIYYSDRWDLNGQCAGEICEGATYSGHSLLVGEDDIGNYYTARLYEGKGSAPTSVSIQKYTHSCDSLLTSVLIPGSANVFNSVIRSDRFLISSVGYSLQPNGHNDIYCSNVYSGNFDQYFRFTFNGYGLFPYYIDNYLDNNLLIYGELPDELFIDNYTLKKDSLNQKADYIALLNWPQITGLKENASSTINFNVSPNPGNEDFKITFPQNISQADVRVLDVRGQMIYHAEVHDCKEFKLHLPQLNAGVYFLEVENGGNKVVRKLICAR